MHFLIAKSSAKVRMDLQRPSTLRMFDGCVCGNAISCAVAVPHLGFFFQGYLPKLPNEFTAVHFEKPMSVFGWITLRNFELGQALVNRHLL